MRGGDEKVGDNKVLARFAIEFFPPTNFYGGGEFERYLIWNGMKIAN